MPKIITRRLLCCALLAASTTIAAPFSGAIAQDSFPTRPMKLVVPYAAGGGTDAIARLVAQGVGEKLGQSLVVENNGSAGGNVATQQAAKAEPDGYTILMANQGPMVVNPHLFKNVKIDPLTAFEPITLITAAPLVVVVPKNSPHKSIKELIDHAQKNPGKLTYGSAGNGSASHLATVLLAQVTNFQATHVPYRGAGPALNDLLGGRMDFMVTTVPSVLGLIESSDVRVLAVTSKTRAKKFPEVPSVAESGWPTYEATAWYGFAVPKGTPKEIADKIRKATVETITAGVVRERLENEGAEPIGNSPEEFAAMMKAESARWAEIVKKANISID
ncbi:tripartite tricarboxylate transporter substrate binding protein [Microvirga sp. KLBC 81]|uniref:Bug family tripartite tricarboxylate transporter substrate binding protein n=1 Tax=Microvirga sp. KLBC 81 TaxID=1862707 RepID=UPI000D514195|nr:tripartite tricarboxylate transporter substrate binding protein [Microvirga sp. KLBC 81]PVE23892.1 tripartite tricarboxylate transporter substrate binding protein [Microvirga sp. KLBC 81]